MRFSLFRSIGYFAIIVGAGLSGTHSANAIQYPIDCAIVLCMAGGFPASTECLAAKAEVVRRITPIPVEPPLQIWRCPMQIDPSLAAALGISASQLNQSGYTKEVLDIQNGIEIYDITYRRRRDRDGETISETTKKGVYGNDRFDWAGASYIKGPEWLAEATGGYRRPVYTYGGRDGQIKRKVGEENANRSSFRAIVLRFKDYEGRYLTQTVSY
ncbi:hypothetical protein [Brucella intermedia]|uniref:hypothetical protein n=1 Tax=Brucella intermedia TaxID=94625 RepID=UPI00235E4F5D|nr:hypothetical protein [Brucella intermedia]